eukprot:Tamp_12574.p1 GENE.Tamp_12574~~Tamp_12574.p1  ORF type:complete len:593 (+),score=125.76 Tamp_12574:196-1779(+)
MAGAVYDKLRTDRPPSLEACALRAAELADSEARAFDEFIADVHESIRNMYGAQIRERLAALQQELAEVLAIRYAEMLERDRKKKAQWESYKSDLACRHLAPHLVVGSTRGPAEWHCLELGCGTGATCTWLAEQGSRVVGIDVCAAPLREARASAVGAHVIHRCIFLQGDVLELADDGDTAHAPHVAGLGGRAAARDGGAGAMGGGSSRILTWSLAAETQAQYERGSISADRISPRSFVDNPPLPQEGGGGDDESSPAEVSNAQDTGHSAAADLTRVLQLHTVFNALAPEAFRGGGGGAGGGGVRAPTQGGAFDLIVDIQCFHVLRAVDLKRFVHVIKQNLKCGGLYFVMTGNDKEPDVGPTILSKHQVTSPFSSFCDVETIFETRFDNTPHYEALSQPPLAWCALFRRRVELDASAWTGVADSWAALLSALGAPDNHLHSVDALVDSMLGDHNAVCRPVTVRIKLPQSSGGSAGGGSAGGRSAGGVSGSGGAADAVMRWATRLRDVFDQLLCDGAFADGRRARFMVQ